MMNSGAQTLDMLMALSNGQADVFMLENSKTIVETVKARLFMLTAPCTRVNGRTTSKKVRVLLPGRMATNLMVTGYRRKLKGIPHNPRW